MQTLIIGCTTLLAAIGMICYIFTRITSDGDLKYEELDKRITNIAALTGKRLTKLDEKVNDLHKLIKKSIN